MLRPFGGRSRSLDLVTWGGISYKSVNVRPSPLSGVHTCIFMKILILHDIVSWSQNSCKHKHMFWYWITRQFSVRRCSRIHQHFFFFFWPLARTSIYEIWKFAENACTLKRVSSNIQESVGHLEPPRLPQAWSCIDKRGNQSWTRCPLLGSSHASF